MKKRINNFLNAYLLPDSIVINMTETYDLTNIGLLEKYFSGMMEEEKKKDVE